MTDIIERLDYSLQYNYPVSAQLAEEAKAEITRLREANKELAGALNVSCAALRSSAGPDEINYATQTAKSVLAKHKVELTPVKYGCHCVPWQSPDECVMGRGATDNCVFSMELAREGKDKTHCKYWKPTKGEQK